MTNTAIQQDQRVIDTIEAINQLTIELNQLFPERELIIKQLIYALLSKEHVLVTGIYGTGKSSLGNAIFTAFEGANVYKQNFDKSLKKDEIVGPTDLELFRKESIMIHNPKGSILEADFAVLDEFLDAPSFILRILHNILNERRFVNGGNQQMVLPLHTAFAATNVDLAYAAKANPEQAPIIDRFMFKSPAMWLEQPASRVAMYKNDSAVLLPKTRINLRDLRYLSSIVIDQNQYDGLSDDIFILYDKITSEFRESIKGDAQTLPSDRFYKNLLKIPEVSALLHGRFTVIPDDFLACACALCVDSDPKYMDRYLEIAKPLVEKAMEAEQHVELDLATYDCIKNYRDMIPEDFQVFDNPTVVAEELKKLHELHAKAISIAPSTTSGEEARNNLISEILSAINQGELKYGSFVEKP